MKQIWNYILENWDLIAPLIYEIVVRLVPTKKNWSLIDNGWKVLNFVIKNKRKSSPEDLIANHDRAKNVVNVPIDKHILTLVILFLSLTVGAQVNQSAKGYYSTNVTDTTFIQNTRTSYQSLNGNTGVVYFDKVRNKWRVWSGSAYVDLATGSGEATTASNGLTETGNNITLGGALTGNTAITGAATNNLQLGTSGSRLFNAEIYAAAAINLNGTNSSNLISGTSAINVGSVSGIAIQGAGNNVNINTSTTGYLQTAATGLSTFTGKHTFTPTATLEGLNVGSVNGLPSGMTNGGIVYNSSGNDLLAYIAGGYQNVVSSPGDFSANRIPYAIASDNQIVSEAAFTYDPTSNTLIADNLTTIGVGSNTDLSIVATNNVSMSANGGTLTLQAPSTSASLFGNTDVTITANTDDLVMTGADQVNLATSTTGYLQSNSLGTGVFTGQHTFTPTSTIVGLNAGSFAGNPSGITNSAIWYNSSTNSLNIRVNGITAPTLHGAPSNTAIPFYNGTTGNVSSEAQFAYNTATNGLNVTDGSVIVSNSSAQSSLINNGNIRLDSDGDLDNTTISETGITDGSSTALYTMLYTLTASTYTPTISNLVNVSATTTFTCQYMRVGNVVTVSGQFQADLITAGLPSALQMTLPIASNITSEEQIGGVASGESGLAPQGSWRIEAEPTTNLALFTITANSTTNDEFSFTFTYQIL